MNTYKKTSEYAYDLLMHFYNLHASQISKLGEENLEILMPNEIFELLAAMLPITKEVIYPSKFMKIDIKAYSGTSILFVLKEIK